MASTNVETSNPSEDPANNDQSVVDDNGKNDNDCDDEKTGQSGVNSNNNNNNNTTSDNNNSDDDDDDNNNNNNNDSTDDNEKTNLIVNYLPQQMTDEEFENLFKKFGSMKSCKIVRNRSTGYSYGFGFVDFETHEQALKAIEELNGHELETKKIKVAFARPAGQDIKQANLYIKNVPNTWTQDDVKKVFEPYGNIIQVRVLGKNRGVAFVLFNLRKQAQDALEALNGKKLDGCEAPLEIKFAADKKSDKGNKNKPANSGSNNSSGRRERGHRGGRNHNRNRDSGKQGGGRQGNQRGGSFFDRQRDHQQNRGGAQYNNSMQYNNNMNGVGPVRQQSANRMNRYAPFVPVQQPQQPMASNPAPMAAPLPQAYGYSAQQPMIPYMMPTQPMMPMNPAAAPTLSNQAGQPMPMNTMGAYQAPPTAHIPMGYTPITQNAMNNIYSVASNTMNNAAQMQPQLGQPMSMRTNNNNNTSSGAYSDDGVTLFVYNIGPDADENELRSMFSPYGHVVKCNVVRKTPGGETKGFGFVTLKDRDQANAAISGLNGSMRNGRALQVSLKK